jgi:hypothetical protein
MYVVLGNLIALKGIEGIVRILLLVVLSDLLKQPATTADWGVN